METHRSLSKLLLARLGLIIYYIANNNKSANGDKIVSGREVIDSVGMNALW